MKKKKLIILLIIIVLVISITGGVLAYLYFFTDSLRSNKETFFKYALENEKILDIFNSDTLENYASKQKSNTYTSEGTIKTNVTLENVTDAENDNNIVSSLQNCNITYTGKTDKPNNYIYRNIKANYTDMESLNFEFVGKNDVCAVKLNDAYNKFIGVENTNLKELEEKLESEESELFYLSNIFSLIPNQIKTENLSSYITLFTDEQLEQEKEKYFQLISDNITEDMFSKEKSDDYTVYTLSLTEEQISNIKDKIFEEMKNDEVLKSALKNYMVNNLEMSEEEANNYISKISQSANSEKTTSQSLQLKVYVQKRNLAKSEIIVNDIYPSSETSNAKTYTITKSDNNVKIDFNSTDGSSSNSSSFYMQKIESSSDVKYDIIYSNNEKQVYEYIMEFSGLDGNQVQENSELDLTYNSTKYVCKYTNNKTFGANFTEDDANNNNIMLLNTAPNSDSIQSLFAYISENFEKANKEKMDNAKISEGKNPFVYYIPAVVPVAITGLMSSSENSKIILPTTFVLTCGMQIMNLTNSSINSINSSPNYFEDSEGS